MIVSAALSSVRWRRQEGVDEDPLPVRKVNSGQTARLIHAASVSEPPFGFILVCTLRP